MSMVTIPGGGFWLPTKGDESYQIASATFRMDASGEKVQLVFSPPKAGNIKRFEFGVSVLGNAPDNGLKCSLQSVSTSDGLPTGTILGGGNAHVTTSAGTPSTAGWVNPGDFGAVTPVVPGVDVIAAVIEFGGAGFVALDSLDIGATNRCGDTKLPFGISSINTKRISEIPIIALIYDDDSVEMVEDELWPSQAHGDFDIDSGTAKNECGLRFSMPFKCRLRGITCFMLFAAANSAFEVALYNQSGTNIMPDGSGGVAPLAMDADEASAATSAGYYLIPFPDTVDIEANQEYIVGLKATTTVNIRLIYYVQNSLAHLAAIPGGSEWYAVDRPTAGSWTRYNNGSDGYRRPRVFLNFDGVDVTASGSSSAPFMTTLGASIVRRAS